IGVLPGSIDVDRKIAANRPGRSLGGGRDAGQQQAELVEIAPVQRQADGLPVSPPPAPAPPTRAAAGRQRRSLAPYPCVGRAAGKSRWLHPGPAIRRIAAPAGPSLRARLRSGIRRAPPAKW